MKTAILLIESLWLGLISKPSIWANPNIVVCAWCKLVMNKRTKATAISHGICWKCYFKQNGGRFPKLPSLKDLGIVQAFLKPTEIHDELWKNQELHKALNKNGQILKNAHSEHRGINSEESAILDNVRKVAKESGMSQQFINMTEMEGEGYYEN